MADAVTPIDPRVRQFLSDYLEKPEAEKAIDFLGKGFCEGGQIVIGSVFSFGQDNGVSADKVIAALNKEWDRNWSYQHPEIRGSVDAPGHAGLANRASIDNVYRELGIPSPVPHAD